jgi:YegS/Rv2252/BmrU family lipid kinase
MKEAHPYSKNPLLDALLQPKRIVFIVNPKAGTNMQRRISESVDKHLNHQKFVYGIWYTEHVGHAAELTRKAREEGYDIVVAVGGDGSINEVASALLHTDTVLGVVPAGSGNGLAMHLGYGRVLDAAVRKINTAVARPMDAGLLNGRPFFNLAGVGYDGRVSNMMKGSKWRGFFPYFLKSVEAGFTHHSLLCTIEMDDHTFEGDVFAVTVANGPMWGYNFVVAPDARIDDGLLRVVILKDAPRWQYFAAVPSTLHGRLYEAEFVEHFTTRRVKITAPGTHYVHVDGEGYQTPGPLSFEVLPHALRVLVPAKTEAGQGRGT